jgi:hypothetical protein
MVDERTAVTDVLLDRIAGTSERATAEADRATAESERATAEAERRRAALRRSILRTLHLRGLDVTDAQRALGERWYAFDDPRQDQT